MNHAAEIAALKRRLDALEASQPAAVDARRLREASEQKQRMRESDARRQLAIAAEERRKAESIENHKRHLAKVAAERAANQGRWRGPDGIWRDATGQQLPDAVAAEAAAKLQEQDQ